MGYCLNTFANKLNNASASDKKIIQYLVDNPVAIPALSIEMLSEKTETSYATIIRFCKRMGFDGFKDMKQQLTEELKEDYTVFFKEYADKSNNFQNLKQNINSLYLKIIRDCQTNITEELYDNAANAIIEASEIYVIGQGTSSVSARYAYLKFLQLNLTCSHDQDMTFAKTKVAFMKKNSVLVAISSSGRTKSIIDACLIAQQSGASVIAITDFYTSPLSNIADISLYTTYRDCNQYLREDFPLIVGQMHIIDLLQSLCATKISNSTALFQVTRDNISKEKLINKHNHVKK